MSKVERRHELLVAYVPFKYLDLEMLSASVKSRKSSNIIGKFEFAIRSMSRPGKAEVFWAVFPARTWFKIIDRRGSLKEVDEKSRTRYGSVW